MIEVKNLVKDYSGRLAVDHLSFTVEDGEILGFLGPNGAGKSTTMNMITGYLAATGGEVIINGRNILEEPGEARRLIGYLPELPPLYIEMTVREYLDFAAELKKIPRSGREEAVKKAIELTMLGDVQGRLIKNLSKGYRQRTGLAQAVLGMPPVIILDEPTVGLDPKQIIEIRDLIKSLGKKHTVILSSHILSEVSAVCDHILIISHGRLAASGTPESLERQMAGSDSLLLTVKGTADAVREAVFGVSGISGITEIHNSQEGQPAYAVSKTDSQSEQALEGQEKMSDPGSGAQNLRAETPENHLENQPETLDSLAETPPLSSENSGVKEVGADISSLRISLSSGGASSGSQSISPADSIRIREELFYALAERRLPILSMQLERASLETVFLELTASEQADASQRPRRSISSQEERGSRRRRLFARSNSEEEEQEKRQAGESGSAVQAGLEPSPGRPASSGQLPFASGAGQAGKADSSEADDSPEAVSPVPEPERRSGSSASLTQTEQEGNHDGNL